MVSGAGEISTSQGWTFLISVGFRRQNHCFVWLICFFFQCVNMSFHFVAVERRLSGNETESHETLAQRIEKDVVGFTRTPAFTTEISSQLCSLATWFTLTGLLLWPPPGVFVPHSKSSTAPSTTSRSLCRGCRRQRRPSVSSTIATRVRRTRRKDQQVCPPFFSCCGTSALTIFNIVSAEMVCFIVLLWVCVCVTPDCHLLVY